MPGSILILDNVVTNRIILTVKLSAAHYHVLHADSVDAALGLAITRTPDLILIDHGIPGGSVAACKRIRAVPQLSSTPILVAARDIGSNLRLGCFEAGVDAMIEKPMNEALLMARIRNMLRQSAARHDLADRPGTRIARGLSESAGSFLRSCRIAMIAGLHANVQPLEAELRTMGHRLTAFPSHDVEALLNTQAFDAVLIDLGQGAGRETLQLLTALQSSSETRHAAHLCIISDDDDPSAVLALDLGAQDLIRTPPAPAPRELALRLSRHLARKLERERMVADLDEGMRMSIIDPLTGLYNRRYALRELDRVVNGSPSGRGFAVMMVDIDCFKDVNDRYGHLIGDRVLKEVALRLKRALRRGDVLGRIGGEEFVAILPAIHPAQARRIADRMRSAVAAHPVRIADSLTEVRVTVSIGLSIGTGGPGLEGFSPQQHLDSADRALIEAKGGGRNKVTLGHMNAA